MTEKETYPPGKHPNSIANLQPNVFSAINQPKGKGSKPGKTMKTLFGEILERKLEVSDIITGAKRKVCVQEAALLKLLEFAFVKNQPWALERLIKEGLHDGILAEININHTISPAAQMILAKAGVAETAKIIEGEIIEEETEVDISGLLE